MLIKKMTTIVNKTGLVRENGISYDDNIYYVL